MFRFVMTFDDVVGIVMISLFLIGGLIAVVKGCVVYRIKKLKAKRRAKATNITMYNRDGVAVAHMKEATLTWKHHRSKILMRDVSAKVNGDGIQVTGTMTDDGKEFFHALERRCNNED